MFKSFLVWMMLAAAATAQEKAQKTVVLVHGAFADGSSWDKVIPLLQARGLKVVAVQNPLTSLADDVAAAKRVIDAQSGPVVLVGHSWGGTVITEAEPRQGRGAGLRRRLRAGRRRINERSGQGRSAPSGIGKHPPR